jgi:hypothetical protein
VQVIAAISDGFIVLTSTPWRALIKRTIWWTGVVGGFNFAMFSPLLIMRDGRWLYLVVPVMLAYVLWLMRAYQAWGRSGRPFQ